MQTIVPARLPTGVYDTSDKKKINAAIRVVDGELYGGGQLTISSKRSATIERKRLDDLSSTITRMMADAITFDIADRPLNKMPTRTAQITTRNASGVVAKDDVKVHVLYMPPSLATTDKRTIAMPTYDPSTVEAAKKYQGLVLVPTDNTKSTLPMQAFTRYRADGTYLPLFDDDGIQSLKLSAN